MVGSRQQIGGTSGEDRRCIMWLRIKNQEDCPGPRKETATRRNVPHGGGGVSRACMLARRTAQPTRLRSGGGTSLRARPWGTGRPVPPPRRREQKNTAYKVVAAGFESDQEQIIFGLLLEFLWKRVRDKLDESEKAIWCARGRGRGRG